MVLSWARALELLRSRPVDIVLTDMKMPVCDGRKMLQSIESMGLDCEIIVLSEYSDFEYMRQAIHAHVADYLLKPVDPERLNELLASAAAHLREKRSGPGQSDPFSRLCRAALGGSAPCPGTGLPPGAQDAPRCPHCGAECEDYFYNVWGEFCGCDVCLTRRDAWQARAASGF